MLFRYINGIVSADSPLYDRSFLGLHSILSLVSGNQGRGQAGNYGLLSPHRYLHNVPRYCLALNLE